MRLTEFAWSKDDSGDYKGNEVLNVQIGINEDGQYEIRNHAERSQTETFRTPEELAQAIASALQEKS